MPDSEPITVLVVDDHALFRDTLALALGQESDLRVIGVAAGATEALELISKNPPNVILMDIEMPGLIAFDAARRLAPLEMPSKLVFLSAFLHDRYVEEALAVEAYGYILKDESLKTVIKAVRKVASGSVFYSERVWDRIVITPKGLKHNGDQTSRLSILSIRELEVLRYIARGLSKKEIAATMSLSEKTVDTHTSNLMDKLSIHDRVQLALFAMQEGLIKA